MKTITVKTGYGYFQKAGVKIVKAQLPPGDHPCDDDSLEYVEVADPIALAAVVVEPPAESEQEKSNRLIVKQMRKSAIDVLKAEGKLAADYTE